jgi:hypothetical protein
MDWVLEELRKAGGKATILYLAKEVWSQHEREIRASGKLLYTWQYDMRWAAHELRKQGKLAPATSTQRGSWALK